MTHTNKPVVIVTGASRGLGAAVVRWLAKVRAAVTLISRSEDRLNDVAGEIRSLGGKPLVFTADVSSSDDCRSAVELTLDRFGRIDALVNNAGIIQPISSIAHTEPDNWRYNIEVNLMGPFYMIQAAISSLRSQNGRIVNVSSGAANRVLENVSAYCAAKAALNHFTRVLAEEEPGLTAVTIRPGVVDTDMQTTIRNEGLMPCRMNNWRIIVNLRQTENSNLPRFPAVPLPGWHFMHPQNSAVNFSITMIHVLPNPH